MSKLQKEENSHQEMDNTQLVSKYLKIVGSIDQGILAAQASKDTISDALAAVANLFNANIASLELIDIESGETISMCKVVEEKAQTIDEKAEIYTLDNPDQMLNLNRGKAYVIQDIQELNQLSTYEKIMSRTRIRSYINFPIKVRKKLIGFVYIGFNEANSINDIYVELLKDTANRFAVVLNHAHLLHKIKGLQDSLEKGIQDRTEELENRANQFGLLNEMGELLHSCVNLGEAYLVIQERIPQIFPDLSGGLGILEQDAKDLVFKVTWRDYSIPNENYFSSDDCWSLRRGRPHFIKDFRPGNICKHIAVVEGHQPEETLCLPLLTQSKNIGVLYLQKTAGNEAEIYTGIELGVEDIGLSEARQRFAQTVAEQIGLAISNLQLQDTLRGQAIRDPLTNLFNRRYMQAELSRKLASVARSGGELGVIMIDLDHFKDFNDLHGHASGDLVLMKLGEFLLSQVRRGDIACRYGGEEFVLILPDATLDVVVDRTERIRQEFKAINFEVSTNKFYSVTLSAGIALFPMHGANEEEILKAADDALYLAKSKGRDRIEITTTSE